MTEQPTIITEGMRQINREQPAVSNPTSQPVFFFDGDFRTRGQVKQRAMLNRALMGLMS